jgi:predicted AAA+ superfamily ATPase
MKPIAYRPRLQEATLERALAAHPVVVLHGARQAGKSTLVQSAACCRSRDYRTLDDFDVLETVRRDPGALWKDGGTVTLDEVQRAPDLLLAVKREADRKRTPGRFLLTGSANLLLMKGVADSLAGRAVYIEVPPMTVGELLGGGGGSNFDVLLSSKTAEEAAERLRPPRADAPAPVEAAFAGGFPVPALHLPPGERGRWFDGYVQTYLERDLRNLSAIPDLSDFRRLVRLAAARNGGLLNQASLAGDAGLSAPTAGRYLSLMETSFLVHRLPAYKGSRSKRAIKAPKLFWRDPGLAAHLAGFRSAAELASAPEWGLWLESLLLSHLLAFSAVRSPPPAVFHWRSASGQEVDLVVESPGALLPIEVKAASRPRSGDERHLRAFLEEHPGARFGVVACGCSAPRVVSDRILAIPLQALIAEAGSRRGEPCGPHGNPLSSAP